MAKTDVPANKKAPQQGINHHEGSALYISLLAVFLAITNLGGANATKDYIGSYIAVSDTYSFYQAKHIRQTAFSIAADQLSLTLEAQPNMPAQARADMEKTIAKYRETVKRYDSDQDKGEGKKELLDKARALEDQRDTAAKRDPNFDYAQALLQIAIVMGSIATMVDLAGVMIVSYVLASLGLLFMVNGYTLLINLPFL